MKSFPHIRIGRIFRRLARAALACLATTLLLALAALLLAVLFRRGIASSLLRAILPHGPGYENELRVSRLGIGGADIVGVRLGGFPLAPSCRSIHVGWSPSGLLSKRIDAVEIDGIGLDASHSVPGFAFPALGKAGEPGMSRDILQGWTIASARASTGDLDFSALVPPGAPIPAALARARLSIESAADDGQNSIRIAGSIAGQPVSASIAYSQSSADGAISLGWTLPAFLAEGEQSLEKLSVEIKFAFAEARGVELHSTGTASLAPCEWRLPFAFDMTPDGKMSFSASLADLRLDGDDPAVKDSVALATSLGLLDAVSNLAFSGEFTAGVKATAGRGGFSWEASASLASLDASATVAGIPFALRGGRARGAASGCGGVLSIDPCHVGFNGLSAGLIDFGRSRATILPSASSLVVSEASIGFCGGNVRLYALSLNMASLSTGFTVFLDNLMLSDFLALFPQLAGSQATGCLYGRIPLRIAEAGTLRLGESFVYTPPGETGNVKIANPEFLTGFLAQAGLPRRECDNFAKALRNLDYEVFRMDLLNPRGDDGRIAIRLKGKARDVAVVTPVNINASINGPIEKFLNLTIKTAKIGMSK
ncbi:MAG: YdbH domain-containing protein [Kiritimatiellae bacterium]|nr:YdbH domain-containing protein [Kiritimatiellia bacterium]